MSKKVGSEEKGKEKESVSKKEEERGGELGGTRD